MGRWYSSRYRKSGRVRYNQSGYNGCSMSVRATEAYEDGEYPLSKWTKSCFVEALEDYSFDFSKLTKAMLTNFLEYAGWHHTGLYANQTDFYRLDDDKVKAFIDFTAGKEGKPKDLFNKFLSL